ncbi:MAG: flagellar assembly protein FliW [Candidatus Cloacimonadota bacterium]|nr:flagellar assembly protein FliW [Candidatus Cloacimonadota bacterium]
MKISTKRFGEINIDESTVVKFGNGILGFPKYREYVLIDPNKKSPLKWLQSIKNPNLAFVVTDPNIFMSDYEIQVNANDIDDLDVKDAKDTVQLVIVTVPSDPSKMTANFKGPLIINMKNKLGKQLVLETSKYDIKYQLLDNQEKAVNS